MKIYTPIEVAKILKTGYRKVLKEITLGKLEAFKIGSHFRITEEQLNNYIQKSKYATYNFKQMMLNYNCRNTGKI